MLGWIDPDFFLGGRLPLDADAAYAVIEEAVAAPLGMGVHEAAYAALTIASENIVGAIREITIMQGIDPRAVTLVAGGGASGLTIVPIARELGCPRVLAPSTASALSACGALFADVVSEFPQSHYTETRSLDREAVNATLRDVAARADDFLDGLAGLPVLVTQKDFSVEARYRAQVWELDVQVPPQLESDEDVRAVEEAFHVTHERIFAVREPGQYLECLLWKARATAVLEKPTIRPDSCLPNRATSHRRTRRISRRPGSGPFPGTTENPCRSAPGSRPGDHPGTDHDDGGLPGSAAVVTGLGNYILELTTDSGTGRSSSAVRELAVSSFDPVTLAVVANRLDSIVREMENTLLRTGRSAVLNMARDFSCALITSDNRLLASAEGLPVHVIGMEFLAEAVTDLHADLTEGDAFLHNDPYLGNTHPADHVILVPVFWEGRHVFTAAAKAHQADCGNAQPTTYMPYARDVYEEGSLIFPAVRVQRDYEDIEDVIRMCRRRIRVPDQWYGDYLAMLGAARIGEARLKEVCARYGAETVAEFVEEWFDYSERCVAHVISSLPAGTIVGEGMHDPFGPAPEGIPIRVSITIDPEAGMIEADLTDNIDCLPAGVNESRTCAMNNCMTGIFNSIDPDIPHNAGTFRRVKVKLRENCLVGIPRFPHSCSVATTNVGERLVVTTQRTIADAWDGYGLAEGACGIGPGFAVVSGTDWRKADSPYVNQKFLGSQGGPAGRVRRLGHVRQRRHQRPDVPRQRRDRRAEVSDPCR